MKAIVKLMVVGAAVLTLTACMSEAEKMAMFRSQCIQFGFNPGSKDFSHCMQKQSIAYEQNELMQQQNANQASTSAALNRMVNKD